VGASNGQIVEARNGLFRYDDGKTVPVPSSEPVGWVDLIQDTKFGLLVGASKGLFRYDDGKTVPVPSSEPMGSVSEIQDTKFGLFVGASNGLFRYDDGKTVPVLSSEPMESVNKIQVTKFGLLVGARNGLFRYDDGKTVPVLSSEPMENIFVIQDTKFGLLVGAKNGLFRYDDGKTVPVPSSEPMEYVFVIQDTKSGLLVGANRGLFRYDDGKIVGFPRPNHWTIEDGFSAELVDKIQDTKYGLLVGARNGLYLLVDQPFSDANAVLENWKELDGTAPTKLGIPTNWTMTHPCVALAGDLGLKIVAKREGGRDGASIPVEGLQRKGETVSFHAFVPVPEAGKWTFRIVSSTQNTDVGKPSKPITFVLPGLIGWLAFWWPTIAASSGTLLIALNLLILVAARYSPAAWRLATDESWGKSVLLPQRLLLSHWRGAQLWLLDLYVQGARRAPQAGKGREASDDKPDPFLALPLTGRNGEKSDSNTVLKCLGPARHHWIQGGAGMGKTAIFLHLRQLQFGTSDTSAFALFRRDAYILVPIEARRFPAAAFSEESDASGWVVGCVRSILSASGLPFTHRGLLRAMLHKGTLAVAIDGLNEVAREQDGLCFGVSGDTYARNLTRVRRGTLRGLAPARNDLRTRGGVAEALPGRGKR